MDDDGRVQIAGRVGSVLADEATPAVDRRAAELLAHDLATDTIERVRSALSDAIRHAGHLPRPLAMMLAHDVDSVACPFLEITDVFTETDWQSLILTISRNARISVARRASLPDSLALSLAEMGDSVVAETLVENSAAPMNAAVCDTLLRRFESEIWVLDKMAEREDLLADIVTRLVLKVSAAAQAKLATAYQMADFTAPVAAEAESAAVLKTVATMSRKDVVAAAETLHAGKRLTPFLLFDALRDRQLAFLEAALSVVSHRSIEHVRSVLERADAATVAGLLETAGVPATMLDDFRAEIETVRADKKT
ncbi:MAG: hypothetical protein ACI9JL_003682 [Paracoccaceae bacterium]|jgi:uncharacterized protein (DUF2336 family)